MRVKYGDEVGLTEYLSLEKHLSRLSRAGYEHIGTGGISMYTKFTFGILSLVSKSPVTEFRRPRRSINRPFPTIWLDLELKLLVFEVDDVSRFGTRSCQEVYALLVRLDYRISSQWN